MYEAQVCQRQSEKTADCFLDTRESAGVGLLFVTGKKEMLPVLIV